jgi:hypothetical protein
MICVWVSPPVVQRQPLFKKAGPVINEGHVKGLVEGLVNDIIAVIKQRNNVKKQRNNVNKQKDDTAIDNKQKRVGKALGQLMYY